MREIVLAVNANRTIPDFLATGQWQPRPSVATLASAMDVGNPSNMERLRNLLPDFAELRTSIESYPVDDAAIRAQIAQGLRALRRGLVPAHGDGVLGLRSPAAGAQGGAAVDRQRDGAPREVRDASSSP